ERLSDNLFWDGAAFTSATEVFNTATFTDPDWTYPLDAAALTDGISYTVHARATDDAGNVETSPTATFTVDTSAPTTTITFPVDSTSYNVDGWNDGCGTAAVGDICGTATDSGSGVNIVQVSIERLSDNLFWDGAAFTSAAEVFDTATFTDPDWTYPLDAAALTDGVSYTLRAQAKDKAVNANVGIPATATFTFDTTDPDTTIDSGPPDPSNSTSATFTFSSNEGGSTFECRLDSILEVDFATCSSPKPYSALTEGSHTFDVRATDPAGNTDSTPASQTWTVDLTEPVTTITSGPPDPSASTSATFEFSSNEGGSTFECRLDSILEVDFASCSSPKPYSALTEGSHTFDVRATDPAGNTDSTPASQTWTVDTVASAEPAFTG
ncbi:hypothetical protein LCGC14_2926940, partial [marine sediment metagenome]